MIQLLDNSTYLRVQAESVRHLYVVCFYGAIFLQKKCSRLCIFSPGSKISILLYVVAKLMQKFSRYNGKKAKYYVIEIKLIDISHRRHKLRRDI